MTPPEPCVGDSASSTTGRFLPFEHRHHLIASVTVLALVMWTLARIFHLKTCFAMPALPWLLHVHGIVMTDWMILLCLDGFVLLIAAVDTFRQWRLHPVFGWGGGAFIVTQTPDWVQFGARLLS